jgi:hypothetical protein
MVALQQVQSIGISCDEDEMVRYAVHHCSPIQNHYCTFHSNVNTDPDITYYNEKLENGHQNNDKLQISAQHLAVFQKM